LSFEEKPVKKGVKGDPLGDKQSETLKNEALSDISISKDEALLTDLDHQMR